MTSDPLFDVAGRVAVVTGASSGLGERFARVLSSRGANVVAAARRRARVEELAAELGSERTRALAVDLTDESAAAAVVQHAVKEFGRLDILVNNAGTADGGPAEREDPQQFQSVINLNLAAVFDCCREAANAMLPQGRGSIINIASIAGLVSLSERHRLAGYVQDRRCGADARAGRAMGVPRRPRQRHRSGMVPHRDDRTAERSESCAVDRAANSNGSRRTH